MFFKEIIPLCVQNSYNSESQTGDILIIFML
jgi:hypothetical protein